MMGQFNSYGAGMFGGVGLPFFAALLLWGLFWKGLGLWHSARRGDAWWFVAILLLNLFGILEIVYLFGVLKLSAKELFSMEVARKEDTSAE